MPLIRLPDLQAATGVLRRELDAAVRRAGRIWNIVSVQSHNPEALRDSMRLYRTVMYGPSPLSRSQREMLAVVTSQVNDCFYWTVAHLHDLRSEVDDDDLVDRFAVAWRDAGLDEPTQVLLAHAERLARAPAQIGAADLDHLREAGFDERAITDATQVVALFSYFNRLADGLGIDHEDWLDATGRPRP